MANSLVQNHTELQIDLIPQLSNTMTLFSRHCCLPPRYLIVQTSNQNGASSGTNFDESGTDLGCPRLLSRYPKLDLTIRHEMISRWVTTTGRQLIHIYREVLGFGTGSSLLQFGREQLLKMSHSESQLRVTHERRQGVCTNRICCGYFWNGV